MREVSLGPLAACDVLADSVVVFDELHNKLIVTTPEKTIDFSIPSEYGSTEYYWAHVHYITKDVLLCLLKSHKTRLYYVATVRLLQATNQATIIRRVKTDVRSKGYKIQSHRAGSQIIFSINNAPPQKEWKRHSSDDRELFVKQLEGFAPVSRSVSSDTALPADMGVGEGVLLAVLADATGDIRGNMLSLGRLRLGVKLRRVDSFRHWRQTFSAKCMTKWDIEADERLCPPVLCGAQALFICRSDPSLAMVVDVVTNPERGVAAAISHHLHNNGENSVSCSRRVNVGSLPPDIGHIWSNIEVFEGIPILLTVAANTGLCQLFELRKLPDQRLIWRHREISLSLASPSLQSFFFRATREIDTGLCVLTIRGMCTTDTISKSYVEEIKIRL